MQVDAYIDELIKREGGYVNNPNDHGGPTKYGITEHVARAFGYSGRMQDLPIGVAKTIYKTQYWTTPGFASVNTRSPKLAEELLDTGVNMGPLKAGMMLQRALNVLNRKTLDYPDLSVDGRCGNLTMYALDHLITKRGRVGAETVLLRLTDAQQAVRYMEIAEANSSQEEFMYGWVLNRVGVL